MEDKVIKTPGKKKSSLRTKLVTIEALIFLIPSLVVAYVYYVNNLSFDVILGLLFIGVLALIFGGMWMIRQVFDKILMVQAFIKKAEKGEQSLLTFQDDIEELKEITVSCNNLMKNSFEATGELELRTIEIAEREKIEAELLKAREELEEKVRERTAELEESNKRLKELSITDGLTGLYNHRYLMEMLKSECARSARYNRSLGFLMLDIDHFKQVNDNHGHLCGDVILKSIGQIIKNEVRSTDLVARYGGEEIAVVMNEVKLDAALKVAEKLRQRIENNNFKYKKKSLNITVSIGVAIYPGEENQSFEQLLNAADHALYRAKKEGRNKVCYHKADIQNN